MPGPDTNGSQFFIMDAAPTRAPDGQSYTIFGQLKDGQNVVTEIANAPRDDRDRPNDAITIKTITIEEKA